MSSDPPKPPTEDELAVALTPFELQGDPMVARVAATVAKVLADDQTLDLTHVDPEDLYMEDTVARARQVYVISYLKLIGYLTQPGESPAERRGQAAMSLAYIQHVERNKLEALKVGRTLKDSRLQDEVKNLRDRLTVAADSRKNLLVAVPDAAKEEG